MHDGSGYLMMYIFEQHNEVVFVSLLDSETGEILMIEQTEYHLMVGEIILIHISIDGKHQV